MTATRLTDRDALDLVHAFMCEPYEWSADTLDAVAAVLHDAGYTFPEAHEVPTPADRTELLAALTPWRPVRDAK